MKALRRTSISSGVVASSSHAIERDLGDGLKSAASSRISEDGVPHDKQTKVCLLLGSRVFH